MKTTVKKKTNHKNPSRIGPGWPMNERSMKMRDQGQWREIAQRSNTRHFSRTIRQKSTV